jgi:hypothetical protein
MEEVIATIGRLIEESQPLHSPIIEAEVFVKLRSGGAATVQGRKGMGSYIRCCVDCSMAKLGIFPIPKVKVA